MILEFWMREILSVYNNLPFDLYQFSLSSDITKIKTELYKFSRNGYAHKFPVLQDLEYVFVAERYQ